MFFGLRRFQAQYLNSYKSLKINFTSTKESCLDFEVQGIGNESEGDRKLECARLRISGVAQSFVSQRKREENKSALERNPNEPTLSGFQCFVAPSIWLRTPYRIIRRIEEKQISCHTKPNSPYAHP